MGDNSPSPIHALLYRRLGHFAYNFFKKDIEFYRVVDLLYMSQLLINTLKSKIFIKTSTKKEYSYIVAPAAKALEGALLSIALFRGIIARAEIDGGKTTVGKIYHGANGKEAPAKRFVLKGKDKGAVDKIYADWFTYRNKVLHYDEDFFVDSFTEAEEIVKDIHKTIRLAYQVFLGDPDLDLDKLAIQAKRIRSRY